MTVRTTDLCDQFETAVHVAAPLLRDFGGRSQFYGPIATVRVFEDNVLVRHQLESPGEGRVLVVDGGGSLGCALLGDRLVGFARDNGWEGVIVNGCIRDSVEIAQMPIGVRALAKHPKRSGKHGIGEIGVPVRFAEVLFTPGHYLYADEDGIIVAAHDLTQGQ